MIKKSDLRSKKDNESLFDLSGGAAVVKITFFTRFVRVELVLSTGAVLIKYAISSILDPSHKLASNPPLVGSYKPIASALVNRKFSCFTV